MKEKKFLINGLEINYKIAGEGPAILILHGWGSSSDSWVAVQKILAENGFKVICPDLPGFGKSDLPPFVWSTDNFIDFIFQFVEKIKLEKFFIFGHSFGGGLALKFSALHPEKVNSLILCSPAIIRTKERLGPRQKTVSFLVRIFKKIFPVSFFEKTIFYPLALRLIYKIAGTYDGYLAESKGKTMKESFKRIIGEDLTNFLSKIEKLTLIIWGKIDDVLPLEDAFLIKSKILNSKLEIIENAEHCPHLETPEKLINIILNFLRK